MTAYIIDTETTGLIEPIEVLSFAYCQLAEDLSQARVTIERLYKPSKPIEWGALATHHILMEDLEGQPPSAMCKLPGDTTYIVGHNIDYDWKALGKPDMKRVCTQAMARHVWPTLDSHKLGALIYYTQGCSKVTRNNVIRAHGAAVDVGLVGLLLPTLIKEFGCRTIEDLHSASELARIPTVMGFGKFKGQPVANVDRGWISWYRRQDDTDAYLLEAFRRLGR